LEYKTNKGVANGYAGLDGTAHIDPALLPAITLPSTVEYTTNKDIANGYAGLDGTAHIASALLPSTVELTTHKNVANGYPGLDGSGNMIGTLIVRYDLAGNINLIPLEAGELAITSDTNEIRIGNNVALGGISFNPLGSQQCIVLSASGTPAQNGLALLNTYASAKIRTPNGAAIGPNNRITILVFPGRYDLSNVGGAGASLVLDTSYINLVGIGGSANTRIITDSLTSGGTRSTIHITANNISIQGFELVSGVGTMMQISVPMTGAIHNDLLFTTLTPNPGNFACAFDSTVHHLSGYYKNIKGNIGNLYGGGAGLATAAGGTGVDAIFEDCAATHKSFGSSDSDKSQLVGLGRWSRVHIGPQTGAAFGGGIYMENCALIEDSYMYDNFSGGDVGWECALSMGTNGKLFYSTIIRPDGGHALGVADDATAATARFAHNCLSTPAQNSLLTNALGTLAASFNVIGIT
jgi:hypothetical protein